VSLVRRLESLVALNWAGCRPEFRLCMRQDPASAQRLSGAELVTVSVRALLVLVHETARVALYLFCGRAT
jgi:hypothetical protein